MAESNSGRTEEIACIDVQIGVSFRGKFNVTLFWIAIILAGILISSVESFRIR
jgi:hypothetical protein